MHAYMKQFEWGFWKPLGFSLASIQYIIDDYDHKFTQVGLLQAMLRY